MHGNISAAAPSAPAAFFGCYTHTFLTSKPDFPDTIEGVSYSSEIDKDVEKFEQSPRFALFKEEFLAQLNYIKTFAKDHDGIPADEVCVAFDCLAGRIFNKGDPFFDNERESLYGAGKRSLDVFVHFLKDDGISLDVRKSEVQNLAKGVTECAGGAAANLEKAANALLLRLGPEFRRFFETSTPDFIIDFCNKFIKKDFASDSEIHLGVAFHNALADGFSLTKIADPTAEAITLPPEIADACRDFVLENMPPARLAMPMADEYLGLFRSSLIDLLKAEDGTTPACFDYHDVYIYEALKSVMKSLEKYGNVDLLSVIAPLEEHEDLAVLNGDATLIALNILETQRSAGAIEDFQPSPIVTQCQDQGQSCMRIMHLDRQMVWTVEDGKACILRLAHLRDCPPQTFDKEDARIATWQQSLGPQPLQSKQLTLAALAIQNVIMTEPPAALRDNLHPCWLARADTERVFAAWKPEEITAYLSKHRRVISMLPRLDRLTIIKGIVAYGAASDIDVQHGAFLFAPMSDPNILPPPFLRIALLRGDTSMICELGTLLLSAAHDETITASSLKTALAGENGHGAPALHFALSAGSAHRAKAIHYFGKLAIYAVKTKLLTGAELEDFFAAKDRDHNPGLVSAMRNGTSINIAYFGTALLRAYQSKFLNLPQVIEILSGVAEDGKPALQFALSKGRAEAIIAFGGIVISLAMEKSGLSSEQVCGLLAGKDLSGVPAFRLALRNGHSEAIEAFAKVLLKAHVYKILDSQQIASLIKGAGCDGTPAFQFALENNHADAVVSFGKFLLAAHEHEILSSKQIETLIGGVRSDGVPALMMAMQKGCTGAALRFGELVLGAYEVGALNEVQVNTLLKAAKKDGAQALQLALLNNHAEALCSFGEIALYAYKNDIVSAEQMGVLLIGDEPEMILSLMHQLSDAHAEVIDRLGVIIMAMDKVQGDSDRTGFFRLSKPTLMKTDLPALLTIARRSEEIRKLRGDIAALRIACQSGKIIGKPLAMQMAALEVRTARCRLGLFLCPGLQAAAKEKMYRDAMAEWARFAVLFPGEHIDD